MSGPFEKYVEKAAEAIEDNLWQTRHYWVDEDGCRVEQGSPEAVQMDYSTYLDSTMAAKAALNAVGPLIQEDARERMVAAAGAALEREGVARPDAGCEQAIRAKVAEEIARKADSIADEYEAAADEHRDRSDRTTPQGQRHGRMSLTLRDKADAARLVAQATREIGDQP